MSAHYWGGIVNPPSSISLRPLGQVWPELVEFIHEKGRQEIIIQDSLIIWPNSHQGKGRTSSVLLGVHVDPRTTWHWHQRISSVVIPFCLEAVTERQHEGGWDPVTAVTYRKDYLPGRKTY